jgi:GntR family transcriptional regulator, carbon starvation induced regulator
LPPIIGGTPLCRSGLNAKPHTPTPENRFFCKISIVNVEIDCYAALSKLNGELGPMQERYEAAEDGRAARTLSEAAYQELRFDIVSGALHPESRLSANTLKDRYKVSTGTLREALTRLVGDSLVTFEGQKGFRVAPISLEDFADLTEFRKLIETAALRRSIENGDEQWEGAVIASFHRLSKVEDRLHAALTRHEQQAVEKIRDEWEARNRDFHATLISACNSKRIKQVHGALYDQAERYRQITFNSQLVVHRDVRDEHRSIMKATLERDADSACRFAADHIDRTLEVFDRFLKVMREKQAP